MYNTMKKIAILMSLLVPALALAQGSLPEKPEDGKCYALCTVEAEYKKEPVKVLVRPEYKKLKVIPAEYKTVTETVVMRPESKKFVYVPAKYKIVKKEVVAKEGYNKQNILPEEFKKGEDRVLTKEKTGNWVVSENKVPDCESADPDECKIVFYSETPEEFTTYTKYDKVKDQTAAPAPIEPIKEFIEVEEEVEPARIEEVVIPAVTKEITRTVLVKDETVVEEVIPAEYATIEKTVLVKAGGLKEWREVPCNVAKVAPGTEKKVNFDMNLPANKPAKQKFEPLPVFYRLGSAELTPTSKKTIDERLVTMLKAKPSMRIRIMAHTDAQGAPDRNLALSKLRAKSVVDYLILKGIARDRLESEGYGDTQIINKCKRGVRCSEAEHAQNRRTEFEVIAE